MNITKESTGNLTARIKIEINENDYSEKVKKSLKDYQKNATMPGFRKGMIPLQLVQKMYGKTVLVDQVQDVLSASISDYLIENKIDLLGRPIPDTEKTDKIDWDIQKEFTFFFDIATMPEFSINLPKLKLNYFEIQPDDAVVSDYIKNVTERFGNVEHVDAYTEKDPSILLYGKFEELNDGIVKEVGIASETYIDVNKIESEEIQTMFMGKKVNEFVDFNYNKAFTNVADIAAMLKISKEEAETFKGNMRFSIQEISKLVPHELNEELYKKVFPAKDITTEDDFKNELKNEISASYAKEADHKFLDDAVKELIKETEIELPNDFLKRWLLQDNEKFTEEKISNNWETYQSSMKWELIEGKLIKENNLTVTEDEMKDFVIENYFKGYFPNSEDEEMTKKLKEMAASLLTKKEQREQITNGILNSKFISVFKENTKPTIKKVSIDEFRKSIYA